MQKVFFQKRFIRYLLLLMVPTCIVFIFFMAAFHSEMDKKIDQEGKNSLASVNANLDLMINNVLFQNQQFTNDAYMALSLKKLLRRGDNLQLSYSDAIYQRNMKAMLYSVTASYPFIKSVYLYLNGYDYYFKSGEGVAEVLDEDREGWWQSCQNLKEGTRSIVETRMDSSYGGNKQVLTFYQKMLLLDGVVIVNIDVNEYRELLDDILSGSNETILFLNDEEQVIFAWHDKNGLEDSFDWYLYQDSANKIVWEKLAGHRYMIHSAENSEFGIRVVSLMDYQEKKESMVSAIHLFILIFILNALIMLVLAYLNTSRTFKQLHYMINVFHDAEQGVYTVSHKSEIKDEYDVIMNNIIYLFLQDMKLKDELKRKQYEKELSQLEALQLQINPHFLFNTLQTVQLEVKKLGTGSLKAQRVLENLADILKYSLADPLEPISLREEIAYLKKYVAIQKIRFGDKFIIYYEVDENLLDFPVFRLMLQPLVENSILHGIRYKDGCGYIKLRVYEREQRIYFKVIDNGVGMTREECERLRESIRNADVHQIGLANVNNRLRLYFGELSQIKVQAKWGMGCIMAFSISEADLKKMNEEKSQKMILLEKN